MSGYRYAVLDDNGVKLNGILAEGPYPVGISPGGGSYVVYEGPDPAPDLPEQNEIYFNVFYLPVRPSEAMSIGDTMDINTGVVTKKPPPPPPEEPIE